MIIVHNCIVSHGSNNYIGTLLTKFWFRKHLFNDNRETIQSIISISLVGGVACLEITIGKWMPCCCYVDYGLGLKLNTLLKTLTFYNKALHSIKNLAVISKTNVRIAK